MSERQSQRLPVAAGLTLPERFEQLAEAQPRAPLVVYGEWRLSYRDVNAAANRLAHRLMALGVARNVPVGLCLDRGPDLLVAILAVLKAGGAYVPLDPQWPRARLRRMREAVAPAAFVTRTAFLELLATDPPGGHVPVIDLDRDQATIAAEASTNPGVPLDGAQWCYVLFTSGSTGTPKGVPITHGNLAGLFPPLDAALGFGPGDVWTWFHSASFGFSVWELWGALLHGGCLVIVPEHIRQDPAALGDLIADEQVTVFSQTPSAYRRLLHHERFHASVAGSRLRYLALSGEAIRRDDITGWLARGHAARLINTYALTETAGQLTLRLYGAGDATEEGARNLGCPLAGREVLVVDPAGRPVSDGTPGELWVGGDGVAPGYLVAAAATDLEPGDCFTELAVPGVGVLRGYRTGDRVRRLTDGSLEYLGRVDAQLKFRGYRIEPGDIEAALRSHPAVRDAAVGLRSDPAGNQRLTGWIVAGDPGPAPVAAGAPEFWPSLGAYGIYDQWLYGLMNVEPVRLAAYRAAFAAAAPGKVVLDIGTGEDAVLARLCIDAGAEHVYAVEVLPVAARRAAERVRSLGLEHRITVIEGDIADLTLPRPVQVCTQGIIGNIGSADGIAGIWNAARRHFAPGCIPVPAICTTRIAALELPASVRANPCFGPLAADYARRLIASVGQPFDLRLCLRNVSEADLVTAPAEFEVLDFRGDLPATHAGAAELVITRDGLLDGCLLWTVVTAVAGQVVDYFREQQAWLPVFLPLTDVPVPVQPGDRLHLEWQCSLQSDPRYPDYSVSARLVGRGGATTVLQHSSPHRSATAGGSRLHRQLLAQLGGTAPASADRLSVTELRRWLDTRLPEHMVPQSWVFLPELPLGPGGKLDREALPAPGAARPRLAAGPVVPRTAAERALAPLWTEVLGIEALGVDDDFFELGGDSISAVQLTTRLQRWMDASVPLAALFEAPTIAGLARHLEEKFPDALAVALRSPSSAGGPSPDARPAIGLERQTPLTFIQQSLWFLNTLYPGDTSASEQFALRLRGPLDRTRLERAWCDLIRRHPVLAARFTADGDQLWQVEGDAAPLTQRSLPGDGQLLPLAEAALREPFDLANGSLVRAVLCRISAESHVLLVTAHHIVVDGLSVPILQSDLAGLYSAVDPGELPAPPVYANLAQHAAWQAGLETPVALEWWRQRLADLPPPALQELVRPPPAARVSRRVAFSVDAGLADGLRRLARAGNATPYMALLAAFRTLVVRLTGQPDLCIGTPMTLRDTVDLRDVVGCLVNPVVLRTPVDLQRSFRAQLQAERTAALETFQYRSVPFSRVVQAVAPERQLGVHPLFQILFSWETATPAASTADGLEIDVLPVPAARASYFDLECSVRDAGEGAPLAGYLAWSSAVIEDWVAEQLPGCLCALLANIIHRPDEPLQCLSLLDAAARRRVLVEWNDSTAPLPGPRSLHDFFLAQAARTPDAVAVRDGVVVLGYGELAASSALLAGELVKRGVSGRNVGVALHRSTDLVLAVLAVLRAGGTVVPLDPGFPAARLQFMAADADLALLMVHGQPAAGAGAPVFDLAAWEPSPAHSGVPLPDVAADATAFMLYTSGSTGQPKAAQTTHVSAVNRCHWLWQVFGFGCDEVFALRTSPSFIDAWWEIFGALGHGVPLQVVPDDVATDPLRLPEFLSATGVTQLVLVPSFLQAVLEQLSVTGGTLPALRWCITSGEPLPTGLVAECRRLLPHTTVLNTYGTSEIWDATAFDTRQLAPGATRVPIGRPVANTRVYIVDAAGEVLPPGIPGELQVAGPGVGPGYWRRPDLTAEKFGPLEFPELPAQRVYRTGDRARFLADGTVECLGRLDAQFKLRGQRIEPAEIEQALRAHPAVATAVVGLVGEGSTAALAAGVVRSAAWTDPDGAALARALRAHLESLLPVWMVPTEWRELPALPMTPTGKVDRQGGLEGALQGALAKGGAAPLQADDPAVPVAPRTRTERELAALWCSLLGLSAVGVHDNFFHRGGHSLLAARLLTRIRSVFAVQLELRALFAAPTVGDLAAAIDAQRAAGTGSEPVRQTAGAPELPAVAALSFGQERLWFLEQLDPGSPAYNVAWTIHCTGPLSVPALRAALDAVVARHPALRTRFPAEAGRPEARIDPPAPVLLAERDVTAAGDPAAELSRLLTRLARKPFDLARGPLFRATLLRAGTLDHHLLLVAHHSVTDATSNHVLFADLAVALQAAEHGVAPGWPPLPVSYATFARRQRAESDGPRQRAALDWWRQRLAGAPPALELPADRPRPAEQRFAGAWHQRSLPAPLVPLLHGFARERGCTPFMVLLAAFKAVLQRYSGAVDVLVGTPVEGRLTEDVERVVGLFINTLVMRTDLSGDPSFTVLLERVRNTTLDAQAHQEVPFERLVEALAPERSLSRSPVFQVMFNLVQLPVRSLPAGETTLRVDRLVDQGVASFDLTLTVAADSSGFGLTFEYATDLFDAGTISQFAHAYLTLLQAALREPGQALSRLPVLDPDARQRALAQGQAPAALSAQPHAAGGSAHGEALHQVVAGWAARSPEAVAVEVDGQGLTYAGLDSRANQLAHHLVGLGLGRGARVGICLPRTADYLVAVLAVLKAGAAYVPLDPDYPAQRLSGMATDAQLSGLICNVATKDRPGIASVSVDLDADRAAIARCPGIVPAVAVRPGDPAYLLYTSGSTGRPKGVLVTHGNLAGMLAAWTSAYGLKSGEAHLQMASAAFDVFTGDWARALGTGGRLVLCPRHVLLDPPALLRLLRHSRIDVAEFVPAVVRLLLEHCRAAGERLPGLRLLIVGSDTWYGTELQALRSLVQPGTRLINSYGVAEATVDSTWFEPGTSPVDGPVPVGRPFPGVAVYVLDAEGEPVPRGVPGELCIGGVGVAAGYWNDAALTACKFGPDPHARSDGARLYRTGDRARWDARGQLQLLGRSDAQFKLRGFRIEPAEIEAVLSGLPGIAAAAVGLSTAASGEQQLAAWLVPGQATVFRDAQARDAQARDVQEGLRRLLPEHLVPTVFFTLAALPLTPNGKVDRAALAATAAEAAVAITPDPGAGSDVVADAAAGSIEATVCRLYAEVLGVQRVSLHTDFFRAGGHSLLATRLVARLRETLDAEVPLRLLFEAPTPCALAAALASRQILRRVPGPVRRSRVTGDSVPLSPVQQRLWFLERLQPGTATYHLHWLLRLAGPLDRSALQSAVNSLVDRHEVLRTVFVEHAGVPGQLLAGPLHIPVAVLAPGASAADLRALVARPFDLAAGPLLRISLLEQGPEEHRLLIVIHHLVADGWSFSVLARELAGAYNAAHEGGTLQLAELPLQYADYALWQRDALRDERLAGQLAYWRSALAGAPPLLELPGARDRSALPVMTGEWASRRISGETLRALREIGMGEGCTLFMVLLAAFKALLGHLAGSDDVIVGTPVAGRSHRALEDLVGFFINTLVLRTGLRGEPTFRALLGRVRQSTLEAFDNADVPFEKLVEVLKPARSPAHSPLVQVLFALHNQPRQPLELTGLKVSVETIASETVKFDLNLHAVEEHGELHVALAWRTALYDAAAMNAVLDCYVTLLRAVVAGPDVPLAGLVREIPLPRRGSVAGSGHPVQVPARLAGPVDGAAEAAASVVLLELWAALLARRDLGPDDDFFASGGHSLLATRLISAIADRLGVELPLISLFEAPTIRELARRITSRQAQAQATPGAGPIRRLPRRPDRGDSQ